MRVSLTNLEAQRVAVTLRDIEAHETVKLSGKVRLDIARNITRLTPIVQAYERAVGAKNREITPIDERNSETNRAALAANKVIVGEIEEMGMAEQELDLFELDHSELRLDDNPRITGRMIAALAPILKDFDTLNDAAQ